MCVCVRVRVRVRMRVRMRVRVRERACTCACACACVRAFVRACLQVSCNTCVDILHCNIALVYFVEY